MIGDGDISDTTLPLARAVDVFVLLGPNGQSNEPQGLIESLLFETGRHLFLVPDDQKVFLVPDDQKAMVPFENVVVAWNGSRESARALAESLPYLRQASKVGTLVIEGESKTEADPLKGNDAVLHLRHHGINAVKYRAIAEEDEIADAKRARSNITVDRSNDGRVALVKLGLLLQRLIAFQRRICFGQLRIENAALLLGAGQSR